MTPLVEIRRRALAALIPPPRLKLSTWIEGNIRLPADGALPGRVRLFPYQREIADSIGDPAVERVTVQKASRIGFSVLMIGTTASHIVNDPAAVMWLQPTEADCRGFMVDDLEPLFEASGLDHLLSDAADEGQRNTLLSRRYPGGSLKVVAARASKSATAYRSRPVCRRN